MKPATKLIYCAPKIEMHIVMIEQSIAASSVTVKPANNNMGQPQIESWQEDIDNHEFLF